VDAVGTFVPYWLWAPDVVSVLDGAALGAPDAGR